VPDEDASKAKNFRLALWQLVTGLITFAIVAVGFVLLILIYTPVGQVFPLSNPGLENNMAKN